MGVRILSPEQEAQEEQMWEELAAHLVRLDFDAIPTHELLVLGLRSPKSVELPLSSRLLH